MERREIFRILAAGAVAPVLEGAPPAGPGENYKPRFFSEQQYRLARDLFDVIIPTDAQSPGAAAARVEWFADTLLHYADGGVKQRWQSGMNAVSALASKELGTPTPDRAGVERLVARMARNEASPSTEADRFFGDLKRMAVEGFCLSEIGMKDYLRYQGNRAVDEFPGCTHPEHQS